MSIVIYILVMAGVTYLVRMIPFTLFRRKIKSRFFRRYSDAAPAWICQAARAPSAPSKMESAV